MILYYALFFVFLSATVLPCSPETTLVNLSADFKELSCGGGLRAKRHSGYSMAASRSSVQDLESVTPDTVIDLTGADEAYAGEAFEADTEPLPSSSMLWPMHQYDDVLSPSAGHREAFALEASEPVGSARAADCGVHRSSNYYVSPNNPGLYNLLYEALYGPVETDEASERDSADSADKSSVEDAASATREQLKRFQTALESAKKSCKNLDPLEYCEWVFSYHGGGILLQRAAQAGSAVLVRAFAGHKQFGRLEKTMTTKKQTLLLHAAYVGDCEAFVALLEAGANVHATDRDGYTVLHSVVDALAMYDHTDAAACCAIVRRALDAGVDKGIKNNHGRTALKLAQDLGVNELVALLS